MVIEYEIGKYYSFSIIPYKLTASQFHSSLGVWVNMGSSILVNIIMFLNPPPKKNIVKGQKNISTGRISLVWKEESFLFVIKESQPLNLAGEEKIQVVKTEEDKYCVLAFLLLCLCQTDGETWMCIWNITNIKKALFEILGILFLFLKEEEA